MLRYPHGLRAAEDAEGAKATPMQENTINKQHKITQKSKQAKLCTYYYYCVSVVSINNSVQIVVIMVPPRTPRARRRPRCRSRRPPAARSQRQISSIHTYIHSYINQHMCVYTCIYIYIYVYMGQRAMACSSSHLHLIYFVPLQ